MATANDVLILGNRPGRSDALEDDGRCRKLERYANPKLPVASRSPPSRLGPKAFVTWMMKSTSADSMPNAAAGYPAPRRACGRALATLPVSRAPSLNERQRPLNRRLGALPRWTKRSCFRAAAKAGPIPGTFGSRCAWIEAQISRQRRARRTYGAAVDARGLHGHEHHPVQGRVAPSKSCEVSDKVEHDPGIFGRRQQCEPHANRADRFHPPISAP